jgi:hypothetical protein
MLALGLRAFLELMEHGVVSWETLSISFVRKVCPCPGAMGQYQHLALMNDNDSLYPSLIGDILCEHEPDGCLCPAPGSETAGECDLEQSCPGPAGEE